MGCNLLVAPFWVLVSSQHDPGTHHFDLWRVSTFDQLTQGADFTFSELYRVVWFWSSHMASSLPKFTPSFPEHIYEMLYLEKVFVCLTMQ
ncbi:hypothetical protein CLDAP_05140 [Caldilinea aerophila DSM 14535 = NBRC 104270]|uniref:Uncharacterized protein n=1 Tax=Caldilinea aerophila (strain DSM 14535 / JCM 11387 / NBRC 104270 / STL-6-O1) TaxID=926550 RepID=I0HZW6_CALAS|nr:hypothetical protein CLDAP_05140 [Caldilinea aerophila DSM 14535 = NBRC 104270]